MTMRVAMVVALMVGCGDAALDGTDGVVVDEPVVEPDPDVNTYVPDGYRPTEPVRVIYLGDSISAGVGASDGPLTYPSLLVENDASTWPSFEEDDLESLFGSLDVVDVAVPGATTNSLIAEQLPALEGELGATVSGESIVVLTIGGNDMQRALLPMVLASDKEAAYQEQIVPTVERFEAIVDYFQDAQRFPDGVKLYMANVYEPTDNEGQADGCFFSANIIDALPYLDRANDTFRDLAVEKGFGLVDLNGHFEGHGHNHDDETIEAYDADDPTLWMADDCIHPNDRGHHELRRLFLTAIDGRPLEKDRERP